MYLTAGGADKIWSFMPCPAPLIQLRYQLWLVIQVLHCPELIIKICCIAICLGCKDLTLKQEDLNE